MVPILMALSDPGGASKCRDGSGRLAASRRSCAATTSSSNAASATVRAIGPVCASEAHDGGENPGERGTSPNVGLMPTTPQNEDGTRIEPTPSVPIASGPHPAAIEAAAPPLDPPLVRSRFQELRVMPATGPSAVSLAPDSQVVVLPVTFAPADFSAETTAASTVGSTSLLAGAPPSAGTPAT